MLKISSEFKNRESSEKAEKSVRINWKLFQFRDRLSIGNATV